jgi:hypothetical protein
MKWRILILAGALILGGGLRLWKLDSRPVGFTWDEAALGYNAYSLLFTGKDEYGQKLPVIFKSFGDYKPGAYIYLTVPAIAFGGLNEFATRLPSAVLGTLLIAVIYVLTKYLTSRVGEVLDPALAVALLAAVNPWLIQFSRGAWEANMALFLATVGVCLFLNKKLTLSALFFGLTFWTYQGAKLFTPLLILSLVVFFRPRFTRAIIFNSLLTGFFILPLILGWSVQSGRLKVFNVFSYTRRDEDVQQILNQDKTPVKDTLFYVFHSEIYDQVRGIALRYINHFFPRFLFFEGDWTNMRHSIPYYGYLHLPEILSVVAGLAVLLKSPSRKKWFILAWLLLAPIPAALSRDNISGVRALPMAVPWLLISGMGISTLFRKRILGPALCVVLGLFVIYYLDLYHRHAPIFTALDWLYPYEKSITAVTENYSQYDKVIFTDVLGQPYIFNLFYMKFDPRIYQTQSKLTENIQGDVGHVGGFDKFEFRPIYWPEDRKLTSTLFVGNMSDLPQIDLDTTPNLIEIADITYPNGAPGFKVVGLP